MSEPARGWRGVWRALRSLRWRLTLTVVALLAVLLAGFGAYQQVTLERDLVSVRADSLHGDVDEALTFIPRRGGTTQLPGATLREQFCNADGALARVAGGALAERITVAAGSEVDVLVFNRQLDVIGEQVPDGVPGGDVPRLSATTLREALDGGVPAPQVVDGARGRQLVDAYPIPLAGGRVCGVAQIATSSAPIDAAVRDSRGRLVLAGLVTLAVALLGGLLLTSNALRPLRRLTETARALAAGDLGARSRLAPRPDEVGTLAHSFDDMAERIESAFAVRAASEARMRRFIADASHELRTPVTALKGYIDVLRRGASREPQALEAALAAMAREAERMRVLVLDLLTLARLDTERERAVEPLDLRSPVGAVLDEGVPGMPDALRRAFATEPVVVRADADAVVTIARNLLVNACRYAPGAAQEWSVWAGQGHGFLRVRDQGPGIDAADLPHLFERFYRGEKTRAREEGGTGLGLSIVQGLARSMGGDVGIESADGAGTSVTVRLPLA